MSWVCSVEMSHQPERALTRLADTNVPLKARLYVEMSHQPERALTQSIVVHFPFFIIVEMSHQPERALTRSRH